MIQTLRNHKCLFRLLYLAKLLIIIDEENKISHRIIKFKQYLSINLWKTPEGKFQLKEVKYTQENTDINKFTLAKSKEGKHAHTHTFSTTNTNIKITGINSYWSLFINISQYQWAQFPSKKAQVDRIDVKIGSIILLHVRNIP